MRFNLLPLALFIYASCILRLCFAGIGTLVFIISFFKIFFKKIFIYVYIFFFYGYEHMFMAALRAKKYIRFHEDGDTGSCELPNSEAGNQIQMLCESSKCFVTT